MPSRRSQSTEVEPDLPPERAYAALSPQLEKLQTFKGQDYRQAESPENEWYLLTAKLVMRAFGSASPNYKNFTDAPRAGTHTVRVAFSHRGMGVDHGLRQRNFQARLQAYEDALKSSLAELELDLPHAAVKGVYEPGQEYELYADVKTILGLAKQEILVVDPYLSREIFDVYAGAIPRTVRFRLLGANIPAEVVALGQKYASGGNFEFRRSGSIHDRAIFSDDRVWVCGQSLKDAAKKKATYIVEHDEILMRPIYEEVWNASEVLI